MKGHVGSSHILFFSAKIMRKIACLQGNYLEKVKSFIKKCHIYKKNERKAKHH